MCGIGGLLSLRASRSEERLHAEATAMAGALAHRGPDGEGVFVDAQSGVALAQRRLAVVDLTATGAQPMTSACGRYVIVYNGELYATEGLRADLVERGVAFRGSSDTEVLLEACAHLGVEQALERTIGMFAFALWDRVEHELWLARDRLGIKPLYVTDFDGVVAFASEVRALRTLRGFDAAIDRDSLAAHLRRGCLPDGRSIHPGTRQIAPGTVERIAQDGRRDIRTWWSLSEAIVAGAGAREADALSESEQVERFQDLLATAVHDRMLADVPLGAFLSGGIDSTSVVALMQAQSDRPVKTFTIGSTDPNFDESGFARAVARHLGTDHTELIVRPDDVAQLVPGLLAGLDEPFSDSSYVPTWLVSELARRHVTVALSGDGGDEVFAGYTRHRIAGSSRSRLLDLPSPLKRTLAAGIRALPPSRWDALAGLIPARVRPGMPGDQLYKAADALSARDIDDLYRRLTTGFDDPGRLVRGATEPASWAGRGVLPSGIAPVERMLALDTLGYLPDDILTKVDRASMAVSLEARVPLLDHRVVEAAWTLPLRFRIRDGRTKWILREVLVAHVPPALTDRPKRGFGQPIGAWLRGPLRPWAEELLAPAALADDDLLDPAPIRALWDEHLTGRRNHQHRLWDVLALQAWRVAQRES